MQKSINTKDAKEAFRPDPFKGITIEERNECYIKLSLPSFFVIHEWINYPLLEQKVRKRRKEDKRTTGLTGITYVTWRDVLSTKKI